MEIDLDFYRRVLLWQICGNYQCERLKETAVFLKLYQRLELSNEEKRVSQFLVNGDRFSWRLPDLAYGTIRLSLDSEESAAMAKVMESFSPVRVTDAQWMTPLVEQLKAVETPA